MIRGKIMRTQLIRLFILTFTLSILITSVGAQNYNNEDPTYRFSEHLKEGQEFTWIFSQYSIQYPEGNYSTETEHTYYDEYTYTDENGNEVVEIYTSVEVDDNFYDYPVIPQDTLYTVKLLKDLGNLTSNYYYDFYEESDEFFEVTLSDPNVIFDRDFLPPDALFRPTVIEFENGSTFNSIELEYEEQSRYMEEYSDDYTDSSSEDFNFEIFLENGIYTVKTQDTYRNETTTVEMRTDVDTGVTVYIYALIVGLDSQFEIEFSLYETVGIDLGNPSPNEELTLPLSPFFVYALLAVPIIVSKFRKQ